MPGQNSTPSRTFTSPSGRQWTATIADAPAQAGTRTVLRFTSGDLVLDLESWPANWDKLRERDLVQLVRAARPLWNGSPSVSDEPHHSGSR